MPSARIEALAAALGERTDLPHAGATVVTLGSVLMPVMELRGGSLADGLAWLRSSLAELRAMLAPGGWLYAVETLAAPWARGGPADPVRRLTMTELSAELARAGLDDVECVYRFRDRIIAKGRAAENRARGRSDRESLVECAAMHPHTHEDLTRADEAVAPSSIAPSGSSSPRRSC